MIFHAHTKIIGLATILCAIILLLSVSYAGISGSNHDFSIFGASQFSGTFTGDNDEVCVYCHTPHGTTGAAVPLWNKSLAFPDGFTVYSSDTLDSIPSATPSNISLLCLSCHDGVSAINSVLNSPGPNSPGIVATGFDQIGDLGPLGQYMNIGGGTPGVGAPVDLSNDHPVSMDYDPVADTALESTPLNGLDARLRNGKVECITCHDPHNGSNGANPTGEVEFLVMSNTGSAMCFSCHIK